MYDYRSAIKHIIENTNNNEHELANSAFAISTICDIILSEQVPAKPLAIPETPSAPSTPVSASTAPTAPLSQPTQLTQPTQPIPSDIAYSKQFVKKLQKIFKANSDIKKYKLLEALHIGSATGQRMLSAKSDIKFKRVNEFNTHRAETLKHKIANELDLDSNIMLNDTMSLSASDAKHAIDSIRKTLETTPARNHHKQATSPKPAKIEKQAAIIRHREPEMVNPMNKTLKDVKLKEYKNFGEMIRDIRKQAHLTQVQFGEKLGTSGPEMSQLENNNQSPSIALVMTLAQLVGESVADLKEHVQSESSNVDTGFTLTHETSDKDLIANILTKPLPMNTYLARRDFNSIKLLNNKGEIVYQTSGLNSQTEKIETGDLVTANIINHHQAHILKITPQHLNLDNYVEIKNALVTNKDGHWITYGSTDNRLGKLNPDRTYYSISDTFAVNQKINYKTEIDIAWRKQDPKYISITKIHRPEDKAASSY